MKRSILGVILLASLFEFDGLAKPVSFKNSVVLSGMNDPHMNDLTVLYSWTEWMAIGLKYLRIETATGNEYFAIPHFNFLPLRINTPESQTNFYLGAGYGFELEEVRSASVAWSYFYAWRPYFFGQVDWETRKYYLAADFRKVGTVERDAFSQVRMRAGFAPHLAEFEELQIWFLMQLQYQNAVPEVLSALHSGQNAEMISLAPLLRFFYRNVSWEIGSSLRGNWIFNFNVSL